MFVFVRMCDDDDDVCVCACDGACVCVCVYVFVCLVGCLACVWHVGLLLLFHSRDIQIPNGGSEASRQKSPLLLSLTVLFSRQCQDSRCFLLQVVTLASLQRQRKELTENMMANSIRNQPQRRRRPIGL